MRRLIPLLAALALGACQTGLGTGEASYDGLARLRADCVAKGGELKLKPNYDATELTSYACVRK